MFLFPFLGGSRDIPTGYDDTSEPRGEYNTDDEEPPQPTILATASPATLTDATASPATLTAARQELPAPLSTLFPYGGSSLSFSDESDNEEVYSNTDPGESERNSDDADSNIAPGEIEVYSANSDGDSDSDHDHGLEVLSNLGSDNKSQDSPRVGGSFPDTANFASHEVNIYSGSDIFEDIMNTTQKDGGGYYEHPELIISDAGPP